MTDRINLNIFKGKYLKIAQKIDENNIKDGHLSGSEISIFLQECKNNNYKIEKKSWYKTLISTLAKNTVDELAAQLQNQKKQEITPKEPPLTLDNIKDYCLYPLESKRINNYNIYTENITKDSATLTKKRYRNHNSETSNGNADITIQTITEEDGTVAVNYIRKQKSSGKMHTQETSFKYNIKDLEDYIINEAVDENENHYTYFKDIKEIRSIPEAERTDEQKARLKEFDNLIRYTTEAGTEYGVDPKQILAIIQQEVDFQGLGDNVIGHNGKGYMQLTTVAYVDILNCTECINGKISNAKFNKGNKINQYGVEVIELFNSRGFNILEAQTTDEKRNLLQDVQKYLTENQDPEFNIRLGTIKLRQLLNKYNGDFKTAAKHYNGHETYKFAYSENTAKYFARMANGDLNSTRHSYTKTSLG